MEDILAAVPPEPNPNTRRIVPRVWYDPNNGLAKVNLDLDFVSMDKATLLSTVTFEVSDVNNAEGVESKILAASPGIKQVHKLGTGETPVDCYMDMILMRMLVGEHSRCYIERKTTQTPINFTVRLLAIDNIKHVHQLSPQEVVELAGQYKESGVRMFKRWTRQAHVYFGRAHKLLVSYPGGKCLKACTVEEDGVDGEVVQTLLNNLLNNLAACLLAEERYEDVVQLLNDDEVDSQSEKAIYRKAQALYQLKRYEEAEKCIARFNNWQSNPALVKLSEMVRGQIKKDKEVFTNMVKKMFQ